MASVKQSFQDGCNTLVNKCQSIGITPSSNSPTDIANAIQQIRDGSLEAGRQQVTGNPNNYNLFTPEQYNNNYNNGYNAGFSAGKKAAEIKTVSKSATYPMAGVNGEQTVDFTVDFGSVSGYRLAYAGITALDTYISNSTIKYVQFSNLRISGTQATWSVHTARGTGGGNNTCTVQGIFIPA